jgi:hypothetical protein
MGGHLASNAKEVTEEIIAKAHTMMKALLQEARVSLGRHKEPTLLPGFGPPNSGASVLASGAAMNKEIMAHYFEAL